jgi:hypothetical protein
MAKRQSNPTFRSCPRAGFDDPALWSDIVGGKRSLPVPLYILGPVSEAQLLRYPNLDGCEFGPDICYLGEHL